MTLIRRRAFWIIAANSLRLLSLSKLGPLGRICASTIDLGPPAEPERCPAAVVHWISLYQSVTKTASSSRTVGPVSRTISSCQCRPRLMLFFLW